MDKNIINQFIKNSNIENSKELLNQLQIIREDYSKNHVLNQSKYSKAINTFKNITDPTNKIFNDHEQWVDFFDHNLPLIMEAIKNKLKK